MRRKVNNSEIHETKRYYEVPSEKVQEWSDTIENLTKQRNQYKEERDTLIDDLSWYKAKVSRLEQENGQLKKEEKVNRTKASLLTEIEILKEKNERLRKVNSSGWKQKDKVINNLHYLYITLTNHIRLKAEANPSVDRYKDLVKVIDRLERADDER